MNWRNKRRLIYGTGILIVFFLVLAIPTYIIFFTGQSTCFDGIQNGNESGVDCGGECNKVCLVNIKPLDVLSAQIFKVTNIRYNGIALVENKNNAGAFDVPFRIKVIDQNQNELDSFVGEIDIPANTTVALFAPALEIPIDKSKTDIVVDFGKEINWVNEGPQRPNVTIQTGDGILNESSSPRIEGQVRNNTFKEIKKIQVVAVVSDDEGVPVAVSSTLVEDLGKDEQKPIFFSWPEQFNLGTRICENNDDRELSSFLGDVAIVIDRSGSMNDESEDPPEPLSTVRDAAASFARSMTGTDMISLITFANEATIDLGLSNSFNDAVFEIQNVSILEGQGIQNTNLADGILKGLEVLTSLETDNDRKAMVILTDGVATRPLNPSNENYPEEYALELAKAAQQSGIEMYVIGLGPEVNTEFLINVAGDRDNYYGAEKKEDLDSIYESIATSICQKKPAIIKTYISEIE